MKKLLLYIGLATLSIACGSKSGEEQKSSEQQEVTEQTPKTKWNYEEETNPIDDSKTFAASVVANETMQFKFPYEGKTTMTLFVRNMRNENDAILMISQGQFMQDVMGNHSILVRFDKNKAENYGYVMPSDGSSTSIFLKDAAKFIEKLKKSEKMTVQCDFFNEGNRTLTFDVKGLEWKH